MDARSRGEAAAGNKERRGRREAPNRWAVAERSRRNLRATAIPTE